MAELFFPQLGSGAMAQYPIRKERSIRTVLNAMLDGSNIAYSDANANRFSWALKYEGISEDEVASLQQLFDACFGRLRAFTFIDPTDNMCVSSVDLTDLAWTRDPSLHVEAHAVDPFGGSGAYSITNTSQTPAVISQALPIPSNYQYCFSIYASCATPGQIVLERTGPAATAADSCTVGPLWSRIQSSGRLNESGTGLSVGLLISPGEEVTVFGPQLEPQIAPSRYRPTQRRGGVYPRAHWALDRLLIVQDAPGLYSATLQIETTV